MKTLTDKSIDDKQVTGSGKYVFVDPPSTMEEELTGYKEKVENMKLLLKHYQAQLESHKVRRDGVETVSRLLAEARQENLTLKKNQVALETTIKNLQNRLVVNGISNAATEDDEVIVPSMSKQTFNNLALENARLRSILHKEGSENLDSIQKVKEETEAEKTIEKLRIENTSMKMKLSDLETLFKSSNNDKDKRLIAYLEEIRQLKALEHGGTGELTKSRQTLAALPTLREQLRAFARHCQDLEGELEKMEEIPKEVVTVSRHNSERRDSTDGAEISQLLEEKKKLVEKVEEVSEMNRRWQKYYEEREKYTQSLEFRIQDLEKSYSDALRGGVTEELNRQMEQLVTASREKLEQVDDLRRKAENEAEQLRRVLGAKEAEIVQLQDQVTILSMSSPHNPAADTSTIELLKAQIQVCTEDFEKERQDRQFALQKVSSLQEQIYRLQNQNEHLQRILQGHSLPNRTNAQEHGLDFNNLQPRGSLRMNLEYDGSYPRHRPRLHGKHDWSTPMPDFPDSDGETHQENHEAVKAPISLPAAASELIARSPKPKQSPPSSMLISEESSKLENFLTCPKCNKEFSEERQSELLAHMDTCWE